MKITRQQLLDNRACEKQVNLFYELFGDSCELTKEIFDEHKDKFDIIWCAANLLNKEQKVEYNKIGYPARAENEKICASAWAEYEKIRDPALAEYEKIRAPTLAEYNKICDPALAEYKKICDSAWAEYEKICASVFFQVCSK